MMGELGKVKPTADQSLIPQKLALKAQLKKIGDKLDRLLDSHLDGTVGKPDYLRKNKTILNQKVDLEEALAKLESEEGQFRLEPCKTFLKEALGAEQVAMDGDNLEAKRDFLKKIGWNFHLESRRLEFEYKNPWGLLVGGEKKGLNFGGLEALNGGRSEKVFASAAAPAAAFYKKSRPVEGMLRD